MTNRSCSPIRNVLNVQIPWSEGQWTQVKMIFGVTPAMFWGVCKTLNASISNSILFLQNHTQRNNVTCSQIWFKVARGKAGASKTLNALQEGWKEYLFNNLYFNVPCYYVWYYFDTHVETTITTRLVILICNIVREAKRSRLFIGDVLRIQKVLRQVSSLTMQLQTTYPNSLLYKVQNNGCKWMDLDKVD